MMETLNNSHLHSVSFLCVLLTFVSFDTLAQSSSYQVSLDTLETFPAPRSIRFNYGRLDGSESPSLITLSRTYSPASGGDSLLNYSFDGENWRKEPLNINTSLSINSHFFFDFDRDGFDDIIGVTGGSNASIILIKNKGLTNSIEFEDPVYLQTSLERIQNLFVRDINNDGFEDLVAQNYTWVGLNNRGKSLLSFFPLKDDPVYYWPVGIFDINLDGNQELYITKSGASGNYFLQGEDILYDRSHIVIPEYPGNILPIDYDPNHPSEVISVYSDIDSRNDRIDFELKFFRVSENFDFTIDDTLTFTSIPYYSHEINASVKKIAIPDLNGADIVFSYSLDSNTRVRHFIDVTDGIADVSSTDTVDFISELPFEMFNGVYARPVRNSLFWLVEDPVIAMLEVIPGIDAEDVPNTPTNVATEYTDQTLTIRWDSVTTNDNLPVSYSVSLSNDKTGFKYRSEYLAPFRSYYDYTQNRVVNTFKYFKNLPSGTYNISVQAIDKFGRRSAKSNPVSIEIQNSESPLIPQNLEARAVDAGIELSFSISGYFDSVLVYRSFTETFDDSELIGKADIFSQTYIDENIAPSTIYNYAVESYLNGKASSMTDFVTISTTSFNISNVFTLNNSISRIEDLLTYDMNLDGYNDLIINASVIKNEQNTIFFLPGSENGFDESGLRVLLEGEYITSLKVADWNGDLQPDLIHQYLDPVNWVYPTHIHLLNDLDTTETISFDAGKGFNTVNSPQIMFTSDLDLNGLMDLVYGGFSHIIIVWNDEDETNIEALITNGFNTYGTQLLDLNQDGLEDLIVDEGIGKSPVVYMNNGGKNFQRKTVGLPIFTGTSSAGSYYDYIPMLFNDDMYPDLLVGTEIQTGADTLAPGDIDVHTIPVNKIFIFDPETEKYEESDFRMDTITTRQLYRPVHFNNDDFVDFIGTFESDLRILVNENNDSLSTINIPLSSVTWLRKILQSDTDSDGDNDLLFLGNDSNSIFQIENEDALQLSAPESPDQLSVTSEDGIVTFEWNATHWSNNFDAQAGYGLRLSSDKQNIVIGNINPETGKKSGVVKYAAFQNTKLELKDLPSGSYTAWVSAYNPLDKSSGFSAARNFIISGTDVESNDDPFVFRLDQNYPNPFNPVTNIHYQVPNSSKVSLQVFDIMGRLVQTLVDENQNAGKYQVKFNGAQLASGIYFYRLKAGKNTLSRMLTLIK